LNRAQQGCSWANVTLRSVAPSKQHAALSLYPRSVDAKSAAGLALSVFGDGPPG
jgi:hypothetical protein